MKNRLAPTNKDSRPHPQCWHNDMYHFLPMHGATFLNWFSILGKPLTVNSFSVKSEGMKASPYSMQECWLNSYCAGLFTSKYSFPSFWVLSYTEETLLKIIELLLVKCATVVSGLKPTGVEVHLNQKILEYTRKFQVSKCFSVRLYKK